MIERSLLYDRLAHGWWKLNDDGSRTLVGSPPHLDLYWAVRSLDNRIPVPVEMSAIFEVLAWTIVGLYPERTETQILNGYDARIVLFEFNDHPDTTQADVLNVVLASEARDRRTWQPIPRSRQ